jgi:hypothetical protein
LTVTWIEIGDPILWWRFPGRSGKLPSTYYRGKRVLSESLCGWRASKL